MLTKSPVTFGIEVGRGDPEPPARLQRAAAGLESWYRVSQVLEGKPEGNRVEGGAIKRHRRDGAQRNRDATPPRELDCLVTCLDAFYGPPSRLHCGEELALPAAHVEESCLTRQPAKMTNVFIRPLPMTREEWDDHAAEPGGRR